MVFYEILNFRKIAAAQRTVFGRKSVEANLKSALKERNHMMDPLFSVKSQFMTVKKNKPEAEEDKVEKVGVSENL